MLGQAALRSAGEAETLSDELRSALASLGLSGRRTRLSRGGMVSLHEGAQAGLHLLLEGRMKTLRFSEDGRVIILDLLDAGDVFGEMSLVREGEPTYAEALQDVEIETIPGFALDRLFRARPLLALSLARLMGARRNQLERRLTNHVFQRVPVRLAQLLLELAERFGERGEDGTTLDVSLSQQDLGNLIGASREIVSLTLSEFRSRGAVSTTGRRITVNPGRLRQETASKPDLESG